MIDLNLSIIAAVSKNGIIGNAGKLPWRVPSDLRRFKEMTGGRVVVVGTRTYLSMPPLEKRAVVVFSRREKPRVVVMPTDRPMFLTDSLQEILPMVSARMPEIDQREIFIGGGHGVFDEFMPYCQRMYITEIDCEVEGDTTFPPISPNWKIVQELPFEPQAGDEHASTFRVYERSR